MCASCFTHLEAWALQSAGLAAAATGLAGRARGALTGRTRLERRVDAWDGNASFLRSLGHDPVVVLGERPVPVAPALLASRAP